MMRNIVGVILVNDKNQLLMYLRDNKQTIFYPNHWSFLGGHVEKNESLKQALKREIKEEINYDLKGVIYLGNFDDLLGSLVHLYKSEISKELGELTLMEGQKLDYFGFEEALKLKLPEPLKEFLIKNKNKIFI